MTRPRAVGIPVATVGLLIVLSLAGHGPLLVWAQSGGAAPRTPWGEPDLSGIWAGAGVGATLGKDEFNLSALERLYRPEVRARMKPRVAARRRATVEDPKVLTGP